MCSDEIIMNDKLKAMQSNVAVACVKVLSWPEQTEVHKLGAASKVASKIQTGQTFNMNNNANHYTEHLVA
jgi:hypothetical protein